MGIDYGHGRYNIDPATGIRYGVIPLNDLGDWAAEDLVNQGDDLDFAAHKQLIQDELAAAIRCVLQKYGHERYNPDHAEMAGEIVENMDWDAYEGNFGDCVRYRYKKDGYVLESKSDGDVFVVQSPYFTWVPFCSPCAPGACYLRDAGDTGDARAYCLGHEWFAGEIAPYPLWRVADGVGVYPDKTASDAAYAANH